MAGTKQSMDEARTHSRCGSVFTSTTGAETKALDGVAGENLIVDYIVFSADANAICNFTRGTIGTTTSAFYIWAGANQTVVIPNIRLVFTAGVANDLNYNITITGNARLYFEYHWE